jgi:hypothetical protein
LPKAHKAPSDGLSVFTPALGPILLANEGNPTRWRLKEARQLRRFVHVGKDLPCFGKSFPLSRNVSWPRRDGRRRVGLHLVSAKRSPIMIGKQHRQDQAAARWMFAED